MLENVISFYLNILNLDAIKEQLSANAFDRIILLNCLHQIGQNPDENRSESRNTVLSVTSPLMSFINMLKKSLTSNGKLVLIHREPNINTLPLPVEVITNWYNANSHCARLIEQLHRERKKNLELLWEVETIKFNIHKLNWFNLLIHRTFYPLILSSQKQVTTQFNKTSSVCFCFCFKFATLSKSTQSSPALPNCSFCNLYYC